MILGSATDLVAIITPSMAAVLLALINAVWSGRQAERARQRERNQERRATLYVDLLVFLAAVEEGFDPEESPDLPVLMARLAAFGSPDVKTAFGPYGSYWTATGRDRHEVRLSVERQIAKELQVSP